MSVDDDDSSLMTFDHAGGDSRVCPCKPCCTSSNLEVTGWTLDSLARGATISANLFLALALLPLAKHAAGCPEIVDDDTPDCELKVYGFKATSILSNMSIITGALAAITMPLIGAILDHTRFRWHMGSFTAIMLVLINAYQITVSKDNWFVVSMLQAIAGYFYLVHVTVLYAYLPELTDDPDSLIRIAGVANAWQFLMNLLFLVGVLVVGGILFPIPLKEDPDDENEPDPSTLSRDTELAQFSQATLTIIIVPLLYYSWKYLMLDRPALTKLQPGQNLLTVGFKKVYTTIKGIKSDYPALFVCLVSVGFGSAAGDAFVAMAILYTREELDMTASESGIVFVIVLLTAVPASYFCTKIGQRFNIKVSYQMSLIWFGLVTLAAAALLTKGNAPIFALLWGVGYGWFYPAMRTCYASILPGGQESELMGIYIFAGQSLVWVPPFVITILNENNVNLAYGLVVVAVFFFISFGCTCLMGSYEDALAAVEPTFYLRKMPESAKLKNSGSNMDSANPNVV